MTPPRRQNTPQEQTNQFTIQELAVITESVRQSSEYSEKRLSDKFRDISWITGGVVVVVFIAFVQMIVSLFQINNAAYQDYSQRLEERNVLLKDYKTQLEENQRLMERVATISGEKR